MKKLFTLAIAAAALLFVCNTATAQASKIGVFDLDVMVQAMPGYGTVDSLVRNYEQDSLTALYDFYTTEYNRLDSTFKADSAAKKPANILKLVQDQRTQIGINLVYWQQYQQQLSNARRQQLAAPIYQQVALAYTKVLRGANYLVILKPGSYEMGSRIDNLFEKVAKELKVTLPNQLRSEDPAEDKPSPKTTTKPGVRKQ